MPDRGGSARGAMAAQALNYRYYSIAIDSILVIAT